ncbi:MAG TPA: tRNA lysidine(34) synthetase TilS [Gemmatimonadaceae bacterium]|nr:tRNA lysidine(34) synthetase TilS [Gemmatimonadaceae bacterium]
MQRSAGTGAVVLAVSGGRDSMALLHAAARALPRRSLMVATFDHATGPAASRAAAHVAAEAGRLGLEVVVGRAARNARSEAGWREERHRFLRDVAAAFGGTVMTAHTRDDQVETVLMRVLRDAGARGLAGLYAGSATIRPLLSFTRDEVAEYARAHDATWVEDPTNASPSHLRNRIRRDLLPALSRVAPGLDDALIDTSRRAARVRERIDAWVGARLVVDPSGPSASIAAAELERHDEAGLAVVWPAIASRVGLAMDWRGTTRAAAFTRACRVGARMPLSGGWEIARSRDSFALRRSAGPAPAEAALAPGTRWGDWRFETTEGGGEAPDSWVAMLPESGLRVRAWRAGDRMRAGGLTRRVKRYLSDAGITGELRARWPVVLDGTEIVWIPGVRRTDAAAVRPGRPGVLLRCDHDRR